MPLADPPGIDVRAVLVGWVQGLRSDTRFAGWEVIYKGGGDWPGAGVAMEMSGPEVVASLSAWPNGCVDLDALRCSDEHLVQRHDEVLTAGEIERVLGVLAELVLDLASGGSA